MFCSEECKDAAMKSFHKYECKHQEALSKVSLHGRFAYRLFFKTLSMFDDSIEGVEKFIIKSKNTEITIFDLDLNSVDKLENDKSRLLAMIALNKDDMSYCDKNSGSLIEGVFQGKHEIGQYFLNHVENMSKLHSHRIDSWSLDKKNSIHSTNELDSFGTYLFGALLNHSCIPNVRGFYVENRIVMYVKQPIRKGQQLFECYK